MMKIKWNFVFGVLVTVAFFSLLLIRLDFFQKANPVGPDIKISRSQHPEDTWMNIYQNNSKIGFVHRTLKQTDKGFNFNESVFIEISTMGISQALNIVTYGELKPDMSLSSFNFDINSSIFRFNAHGQVVRNKLILFAGLPNAQEKTEIPLKSIPHISDNIYDAAFQANLEKNKTSRFSIFDPSTMSLRAINVTRMADEIIPIMGERILSKKYCADFMGVKHCAWLDKDGIVLKETSFLGLTMEKTSKGKALEGLNRGDGIDFTQLVSIPSNIEIADPQKLRILKINITGIDNSFFVNGDRQSLDKNILTITRENLETTLNSNNPVEAEISLFLKPSPLIQSNHPSVTNQVNKIIKPNDTQEEKVRKIIAWVYRNIEKKPTLSIPNALEVLKNKSGDCNEHTVLTVALLRAAGIPAQSEAGLVYLQGRFYYHAWCVAYINQWITADAVFNQFPADVTHIRLIRGESDKQLNLMGVIGKIKLEVLEAIK